VSSSFADRITALFDGAVPDDRDWLRLLVGEGLDQLPMPGEGDTWQRWMALAAVGQFDLSLTKLYEGHTDALAILAELGQATSGTDTWCVWAAEPPNCRAVLHRVDGKNTLSGRKCWCSGAATADYALLTCWTPEGTGPLLARVKLDQQGVRVEHDQWKAVGMADSASLNVVLDHAVAEVVGDEGEYLSRPGFWHGGAGVAACWYGGALGIAKALRQSMLAQPAAITPFKLASLGKASLALAETAAILRDAAVWIDANPAADASAIALAARLSAEKSARSVLTEVGTAMGATPFCLDGKFARAAADLPVFIRQCHGDRDYASLGEHTLSDASAWELH
jgi:alkylation response protein AidB-like acyl-CoA dehydrogenase